MYLVVVLVVLFILIHYLLKNRVEEYDFKCFLLTLPSEHERRERFLSHHPIHIPLEIVYGPDTRDIKVARKYETNIVGEYFEKAVEMHYDERVKRPDITFFNMGAIGCYMGHLKFYQKCFEQDLKYAVIFEDNVVVKSPQLYKEIQQVIDEKGDDFEMCFFHCLSRLPDKIEGKLEKVKWISSTKCYLINVENMKEYVKYFLPMDNHIDMKHEDLIARGARVYYKDLRKYMMIDRTHKSTIGHREHGRPQYFSRIYPTATPLDVKRGY